MGLKPLCGFVHLCLCCLKKVKERKKERPPIKAAFTPSMTENLKAEKEEMVQKSTISEEVLLWLHPIHAVQHHAKGCDASPAVRPADLLVLTDDQRHNMEMKLNLWLKALVQLHVRHPDETNNEADGKDPSKGDKRKAAEQQNKSLLNYERLSFQPH